MNKIMILEIVIVAFVMLYAEPGTDVQAGTVVFVEQERYVQAEIVWGDPDMPGGGEDYAEDFASGYGLFDSTVSVSTTLWSEPWATADQLSEIVGPAVTASGSAESGNVEVWAYAMSVSSFSLTFELTAAQEFSIAGSLSADGRSSTSGILFTGPAGTILDELLHPPTSGIHPPMYAEFNISGTLDPGRYTLNAWSLTEDYASGIDPTASFSFVGVIPEPSTVVLLSLGMGYLMARKHGKNKDRE